MKPDPDNLCRSVMSQPPVVLKPGDSLRSALQAMVEYRVPALAVADGDGRYVGMLPRSRLIALAMPRVLWLEDAQHPFSRVQGGFIQDTLANLQERIDAVANDPVSRHIDPQVPVIGPDSTLMSAMLYLHRQRNILPVVEQRQFLGVVTVWDVLARIGRMK
jgi:CBS domain-containing protein